MIKEFVSGMRWAVGRLRRSSCGWLGRYMDGLCEREMGWRLMCSVCVVSVLC